MSTESKSHYSTEWHSSLGDIGRDEWNALAGPLPTPFLEWEWLHQLEASGSISPRHGWMPMHLAVRREGTLVAAAPLYVKSHSSGEFVWDYIWVDVAQQLGARYFPKLVGMIPATPSVGYRFLVAAGEPEERITDLMLEEIDKFCKRNNIGGLAFNFVDDEWATFMSRYSFNTWKHQSFLWENEGFESFDDYLGVFNKNQRRNIKRERRYMEDQGVSLRPLCGDELTEDHFSLMWHFYEVTNDQFGMWAAKYLNRRFFEGIGDFRHRLLLVAAYSEGAEKKGLLTFPRNSSNPVAMAFLVYKNETLVGRYWGTDNYFDSLHFNTCYYTPIEWAIDNRIRVFDPGAGSSHKIRRGFRAVSNNSLHRFYDQRMHYIMAANIDRVNAMEQRHIDDLNNGLPFAKRGTEQD